MLRKLFLVGFAIAMPMVSSNGLAIDCNAAQRLGNSVRSSIISQLNGRFAGASQRINRRKTVRINRISSISFNGCNVTARANVTLKRKIRRDAHGTATVRAKISSFNLGSKRVCFKNVNLSALSLSRTLGIGERFYRWIANKVLPNNQCLSL